MNIRLTHIDGKLPNLTLMKLAHWHSFRRYDEVVSWKEFSNAEPAPR